MNHASIVLAIASVWVTGCSSGEPDVALAERTTDARAETHSAAPVCRVADAGRALPEEARESSGLAQSRRNPGLFWTHNDAGNDPDLFAVDADGRLVQRVRVAGAELVDWEDIAAGPCDAGTCLYVGDIGDNSAERERITIYRVPESDRGASETARAAALHARFPDGAHDAEALFVLPSGELFVVTKGRRSPIRLYRYPLPQQPGETVVLERVRELFPEPDDSEDRVTGATASPDGRWVGVRTARTLHLYRAADLMGGGAAESTVVDLSALAEPQGEAVAIAEDGTVWLSSEAESKRNQPQLSRLQCTFPDG
jgi:hypothetical protein